MNPFVSRGISRVTGRAGTAAAGGKWQQKEKHRRRKSFYEKCHLFYKTKK